MKKSVYLAAVAAIALAGCGERGGKGAEGGEVQTITIDGSSTVFPPTEAVAEEFQQAQNGRVRVTVGISGTGGGFKKFCRGESEVQNSSRPILAEEMAACRAAGVSYYELPIAFDALTVAVNPANTWAQCLTIDELKKVWEPAAQGRITHWNQIRSTFPNEKIGLYGAGSDSGTFDYFTEAVVGEAKSSRGDYTGSEDDNVLVRGIESDRYALGYIPYAYFAPHAEKMKAVAIDSGNGCVLPNAENVTNGTYASLSRPLFIYVNAKALEKPHVREFVDFYMTKGAPLIQQVKYVPLPAQAYQAAMSRVTQNKTGTGFGGKSEVGLPIGEILNRQPKS